MTWWIRIMESLLLTGFEPFGDYKINPSEIIAQELDGKTFTKIKVIGKSIPLRYTEIKPIIVNLINEINPIIIINMGQAPRSMISIERVAINLADVSKTAYNCDSKPDDEILVKEGPAAYFSTLPVKQLAKHLQNNDIPCQVSNTAGTFGCNQIMYHTLNHLDISSKIKSVLAGFIHLPLLPEQVVSSPQTSSMSLDLMKKAIILVIEFLEKQLGNK